MVADGIEELVPYAKERGIKLGIEPLHPMYAAERSVIVSLAQANDLAEKEEFNMKSVLLSMSFTMVGSGYV